MSVLSHSVSFRCFVIVCGSLHGFSVKLINGLCILFFAAHHHSKCSYEGISLRINSDQRYIEASVIPVWNLFSLSALRYVEV